MLRLLRSINQASGDEARNNWEITFKLLWGQIEKDITALPKVTDDQIQITFPPNGGVLGNQQPKWGKGFSYVVRGTLKQRPHDHTIWLLNANKPDIRAAQRPQDPAEVTYDEKNGEWEGRVFLPYSQTSTFVNAVVAPPTSQQFFIYYQQYGESKPMAGIPIECKKTAQIFVKAPPSHKAPSS
jgi:hypothetical protein